MRRIFNQSYSESGITRMGFFGGIRNKLIFFFLLVSLVPIILIGALSFVSSRRDMVQKIQEYSISEINQAVAQMQLKLEEFENIGVQLSISTKVGVGGSNSWHLLSFVKMSYLYAKANSVGF